jgi:hypothetical protein
VEDLVRGAEVVEAAGREALGHAAGVQERADDVEGAACAEQRRSARVS